MSYVFGITSSSHHRCCCHGMTLDTFEMEKQEDVGQGWRNMPKEKDGGQGVWRMRTEDIKDRGGDCRKKRG